MFNKNTVNLAKNYTIKFFDKNLKYFLIVGITYNIVNIYKIHKNTLVYEDLILSRNSNE